MKNTGIKDRNGNKIYVGSKVIKAWGWVVIPGKPETAQTIYKTHTIVEDKHKDKYQSSRRYRLGKTYNRWTGEDVAVVDKVMSDKLDALEIKEDDTMGFFIIDGNMNTRRWKLSYGKLNAKIGSENERKLDKKIA